mmetsp:Transcript_36618/g.83509  ORF Transcript_36618/g.83509 Transcript_36618/m.83509 type:complete len:267 (+) Transcript_36618:276-1076(+)
MRSGSWQLRTVPEREPHELEQPEHGEGLPAGHRTGAGGTLLGEDGAGRAAHIGRDTGVDTEGGRDAGLALLEDVGRRRRGGDEREGRAAPGGVHRRTGRDARRHREHALRRGAPPAPGEPRLQEPVHSARLVGARHGRPGGAEDEADAARRARPAERRPEPHGDILQVQGGTRTIHEEQDRELLPRRRARLRAVRARREQRLPRPAPAARAAASPHPGGESQARVGSGTGGPPRPGHERTRGEVVHVEPVRGKRRERERARRARDG